MKDLNKNKNATSSTAWLLVVVVAAKNIFCLTTS
jgi:hypothetical protein